MAFGDQRVADPATRALLVREWLEALAGVEADTLTSAVSHVIRSQKFWPTVSELVEAVKRYDFRTAEEKFGPRHGHHEPEPAFCRQGRTVAEEIAHRVARLKAIKAHHGYTAAPEHEPPQEPPKPASQDMRVSDALRAIAIKRGYWHGEGE